MITPTKYTTFTITDSITLTLFLFALFYKRKLTLVWVNDIIILKLRKKVEYEVYGILPDDAEEISDLHLKFY